jgi:Ser/Thr protein kinase RdoA (MazF antagonist)
MERNIVTKVLAAYGITGDILPPQKGYRNTSYPVVTKQGVLNLIFYKSEPGIVLRIRHANRVADFLAEKGMPVRRTLDTRIIQLKAREHVKYACLYTYLPGRTIPWEAYSKDHIKVLGANMSAMHALLAAHNTRNHPRAVDELRAINKRMLRYFADNNVQRALNDKLHLRVVSTNFERILRLCQSLPHQQPLHMDFVRGNILFEGKTMSGIVDFEKTAVGHPVIDIARTLAFLLVDCKYKEGSKVRKYFLYSGYAKRGAAPLPRIMLHGTNILEPLMDFFLLHDFYKFLRHNPYESLPQNEHFLRTKQLLLRHSLLEEK